VMYATPVLVAVSPETARTDGGVSLVLSGTNLGVGSNYEVSLQSTTIVVNLNVTAYSASAISVLSPSGSANGPLRFSLTVCADSAVRSTCLDSDGNVFFHFSLPVIYYVASDEAGVLSARFDSEYYDEALEATRTVKASCDRFASCSGGGCGLGTQGGYEVALVGANFGAEPPRVELDGVDQKAYSVADRSTHSYVRFTVPKGFGSLEITVSVGAATCSIRFQYDAPCVTRAEPNNFDARGEIIQLHGLNFGDAAPASVWVGGEPCVAVGAQIWTLRNGEPVLFCRTGSITVGPKSLVVNVANQTASYAKGSAGFPMLTAACGVGSYGQRAWTPFLDESGCDECTAAEEACTWNGTAYGPGGIDCVNQRPCVLSDVVVDGVSAKVHCVAITRIDEKCLPCPLGSTCADPANTVYTIEPVSNRGFFRVEGSCPVGREEFCYNFEPCSPTEACAGGNVCGKGYTGAKCAMCCDAGQAKDGLNGACGSTLYHRSAKACVECPQNLGLLAGLFCVAVVLALMGAWWAKRRRVDVSVIAIGIDFAQVLSVFAASGVQWPAVARGAFRVLSLANFKFLDVFPPECLQKVSYRTKWLSVQFAPLVFAACCYVVYSVFAVYTLWKFKRDAKRQRRRLSRLCDVLNSALLYGFYFVYLVMCQNTLDVLNCAPQRSSDGTKSQEEYLASDPSQVCWRSGSTQSKLAPVALAFVFIYILGYPLLLVMLLASTKRRGLIFDDQLLRLQGKGGNAEGLTNRLEAVSAVRTKLGLLYFRFEPHLPFWIIVVVLRKAAFAVTALHFQDAPAFQLACLLLILFASAVLQLRHRPYASPRNAARTLSKHAVRVTRLNEEASCCDEAKDEAFARARHKVVRFGESQGRTFEATRCLYEYNTVEGTLLACAVLLCLFGVMLGSDYLAQGQHSKLRHAIVGCTVATIAFALAYFALVVWHEVVSFLLPQCSPARLFGSNGVVNVRRESAINEAGLKYADPHFSESENSAAKQAELRKLVSALRLDNSRLRQAFQAGGRRFQNEDPPAAQYDAASDAESDLSADDVADDVVAEVPDHERKNAEPLYLRRQHPPRPPGTPPKPPGTPPKPPPPRTPRYPDDT